MSVRMLDEVWSLSELEEAHHLDPGFYDEFFGPGAYGRTHAGHMAASHGTAAPAE